MEQLDERRKLEYGAPELKKLQARYSIIGLFLALTLHFLGAGAYWGSVALMGNEKYVSIRRPAVVYGMIQLPPPLGQIVTPDASSGGSKTRIGTPVPVPPWQVDSEVTFRKQTDPDQGPISFEPVPGSGGVKTFEFDPNEPPPPFVAVEKLPEAVKQVPPKYPELATRAGLEGTVWVNIWVDREGRPKKAVVQKSDAEIFNQPATDAAMQWIFTPAMMKNGPVSVWVSIPFRFKLQGK
jgi:TonB family protein